MSKRELYYELRRGGMGRETARACVVETSLMGRLNRLDYWLAKLRADKPVAVKTGSGGLS